MCIYRMITGAALTLALVIAAAAQDAKPTMDETIRFLIDKSDWIAEIGPGEENTSRTWQLTSPRRCELVWTTTETNSRYDARSVIRGKPKVKSTSPTSVSVNLADFDPSKIGVDVANFSTTERIITTHSLHLETTDRKKSVSWSGVDQHFLTDLLTIRLDNDESATRYANAIRHAITLCGGKISQKKEPF